MQSKKIWPVLLTIWSMATATHAGIQDKSASFSLFAGGYVYDGQEHLEAGPILGARAGYDMIKYVGIEGSFGFAQSRSTLDKTANAYNYLYQLDALFYLLPQSDFVPYLTVGGGIKHTINSPRYGTHAGSLLDYGVGAKYFLADSLALRGDARQIGTFSTARDLNYEVTFGLNYYFGRQDQPSRPVAAVDTEISRERPVAIVAAKPATEATTAVIPPAPSQQGSELVDATKGRPALNQAEPDRSAEQAKAVAGRPAEPAVVRPAERQPAAIAVPGKDDELMTMELHIVFATGSSKILPRYHDEVMRLAEYLRFYPAATARITGYDDGHGSLKLRRALAQKRAESVRDYLHKYFSLAVARISISGSTSTPPPSNKALTILISNKF